MQWGKMQCERTPNMTCRVDIVLGVLCAANSSPAGFDIGSTFYRVEGCCGEGGRTILQRNPCCATTTRALNAQHMIHLLKDDNRPHDRTAGSTGEAVGYGSVYEVADSKPSWLPVEALAAVVEYHGTRAKGVWDQKLNVTHLSTH